MMFVVDMIGGVQVVRDVTELDLHGNPRYVFSNKKDAEDHLQVILERDVERFEKRAENARAMRDKHKGK